MTKRFPKEIFIYACDEVDGGTPVYAVVTKIDELPEMANGEKVANYTLNREHTLRVRRELK
jgi:hypothetical protein